MIKAKIGSILSSLIEELGEKEIIEILVKEKLRRELISRILLPIITIVSLLIFVVTPLVVALLLVL